MQDLNFFQFIWVRGWEQMFVLQMEINVFSPGGLEEAERFEGVQFNQAIIRDLEEKVTATSLS